MKTKRKRGSTKTPTRGTRARGGAQRRDRATARPRPGPTRPSQRTKAQALTFEEIAAQITAAEQELADAGAQLADPEVYREGERVKTARARYEHAQRRLDDLYRQLGALDTP